MEKQKRRKSIAQKIRLGYIIILTLMVVTTTTAFVVLRRSIAIDKKVTQIYQPSLRLVDDLSIALRRSERLSNNWIYQANIEEKKELQQLQAQKIPSLQKRIQKNMDKWQKKDQKQMKSLLLSIDSLMNFEKVITLTLQNLEDYDDDISIDEAIQMLEINVQPSTLKIADALAQISKSIKTNSDASIRAKYNSFVLLEIILISFTLIAFLIGGITSYRATQNITKPLNRLRESLIKLGQGKLETLKISIPNDEVGDMIKSSNILVNGLQRTAAFAKEIEKGNFETNDDVLSQIQVLDHALLSMRDSLAQAAQKEEVLKWIAQGQAKLSEIMRNHMSDVKTLSHELLSALIAYLNVELGGIFTLNEAESHENNIYLDLKAAYAYNRKKFIRNQIHIRDNISSDLVSQAFLEGKTIVIENTPQDYLKITSGFGETNPDNIILVPLIFNEITYGVIEIASIHSLEAHKIEFLEKVAESFASTLATVSINENTQALLSQSQDQTEQLRAQEEEMRQNMEELQTTQENMYNKQKELEKLLEDYQKLKETLKTKDKEIEKFKSVI